MNDPGSYVELVIGESVTSGGHVAIAPRPA